MTNSELDEYTRGYSLEVPKIVRFRPNKEIAEINSVKKLQELYKMPHERHPFQSL
jgi:hypothetical protein